MYSYSSHRIASASAACSELHVVEASGSCEGFDFGGIVIAAVELFSCRIDKSIFASCFPAPADFDTEVAPCSNENVESCESRGCNHLKGLGGDAESPLKGLASNVTSCNGS